jgi:hypothetical protein
MGQKRQIFESNPMKDKSRVVQDLKRAAIGNVRELLVDTPCYVNMVSSTYSSTPIQLMQKDSFFAPTTTEQRSP